MFPFFPYSNFHRLNADWILEKVKELATTVERVAGEVASWADRITQAENTATAAQNAVNNCVKFIPQGLNAAQKQQARTNIGAISANDIPQPQAAVLYTEQQLTSAQKQQARTNIDAISASDIPAAQNAVLYTEQQLTSAQKQQARTNIGAISANDIPQPQAAVLYTEQQLTSAQKQQARTNIDAISAKDIPQPQAAVLYTEQQLTSAQKQQARTNIGAANAANLAEVVDDLSLFGTLNVEVTEATQGVYSFTPAYKDIVTKLAHGAPVIINYKPYGSTFVYRGLAFHSGSFSDPDDNPTIIADLLAPNNPASIANSAGYHVYISYANNTASIIVSDYEYRYAPPAYAIDAGKILDVGNTGTPAWSNLFITIDGTSGTVDINTLTANWGVRPIIVTAIVDSVTVQAQVISFASNYYGAVFTTNGGSQWIRIGGSSGNIFT